MKTLMVVVTLAGTLTAGAGLAAPLQTLHVTETVEIKAPLDKVWATVKDFDGLAKRFPAGRADRFLCAFEASPFEANRAKRVPAARALLDFFFGRHFKKAVEFFVQLLANTFLSEQGTEPAGYASPHGFS